MSKQPKIIITGTGRTGTTVLVKLLTLLKFPTGFTPANFGSIAASGGGLEFYCTGPNQGPLIVKAPQYVDKIEQMQKWYNVRLVIIPVRNLHDSAASRANLPKGSPGSLWGAEDYEGQVVHNAKVFYNLVQTCTRLRLNMLFLPFPEFVNDPDRLYFSLNGFFDVAGRKPTPQEFKRAFGLVMDPGKVKSYE